MLGVEFGDRITSFLPSAHIADRLGGLYIQEVFGTQVTVVPDARAIAAALPDVRPTIWGAVPRVWEKLKAAIEFAVANEPDETKRQGLQWALSVAAKTAAALVAATGARRGGRGVGAGRRAGAVQAAGEARSRPAAVGGVGCRADPEGDARVLRRPRYPDHRGLGHVGAELRCDGEPSARCAARHRRQAAARDGGPDRRGRRVPGARAAGDEGLPQGAGRRPRRPSTTTAGCTPATSSRSTTTATCKIVDRKKELIINAAGKNMSPANIENAIKAACPLIGVMLDDRRCPPVQHRADRPRRRIGGPYAAQRGLADASPEALAADPEVIAEIAAGVAEGNAKLSRVEQIKRFRVLPTFWEPGGDEITLDDEAQAQADPREVRRRDRGAVRRRDRATAVHEPKAATSAAQ